MNFSRDRRLETLCEEMRQFAEQKLERDLQRRDAEGSFHEENWQACAGKGILGLYVPEEYGGSGYDMVTTIHLLESLGYGCPDNGFTLGINGQMWAVQEPILKFGTEEQKKKYLPPMINGTSKGAHGMTEESSGSNAFQLKTTAEKVDGGYVLNGKKIYIGLGPVADIILTFASTNPGRGRWGISTFIVDAKSNGITLSPAQSKMGLRTGPMGEIEFKDVFVPADCLLGKEGAGASIFNSSMDYERSFIFTSHVGSMARQLDDTVLFVKQRKVGGDPIGKFQSVSNRIADMKVRLETARMFLHRCASLIDQGQPVSMEAAMAKLVISELFVENSLSSIRLHGGKGYLSGSDSERDLRDAIGGVIYSGTSDIQRNLIAALLGL
ncbi:MAG: acyl-CoA dehydrogenase family protein [Planctomycetota bacterium]